MVDCAPADTFVCYLDRRAAREFDLKRPNVRPVLVDLGESPTLAASADGRRSVTDLLRLTHAVWQTRPDVFFCPSVYTFFPLPLGLRAVVTIHDTIVERFPELTLPRRSARLFWRAKVRAALWQATLVLTVSEYAAAEIATMLGVAPSRIRIALEAPADAFRPSTPEDDVSGAAERVGIPAGRPWIIYVGGFNPHKNVEAAVRAHARVARALGGAAPLLILVGPLNEDVFHGGLASIRAAIANEGTEALVRWAGYVPDDELRHLYAGAQALVLPSVAEGFGLPAVEAARCGTPVVATTASPLPQLLAGGGFFVTPDDLEGLANALSTLCRDHAARQAMGAVALERSSRLTWHRTADAVVASLREAASGRGPVP
ncbi:MAG: glycosyltransferase family 4 protein, partial [Vicinamibacterales bacterium]